MQKNLGSYPFKEVQKKDVTELMAKKKIERNGQWKIKILNEIKEDRNTFCKLNMWLYLLYRLEVNKCVDKEKSIDK